MSAEMRFFANCSRCHALSMYMTHEERDNFKLACDSARVRSHLTGIDYRVTKYVEDLVKTLGERQAAQESKFNHARTRYVGA